MDKIRRFMTFFGSLIVVAIGAIIVFTPSELGYIIVALIIGLIITYRGVKTLIFYFSSARHMVGGGRIFVNSIILIDFGSMAIALMLQSSTLAMIYIIALFMLLGVIDILRSLEIKKNGSKKWIWKFIKGLLIIGVGVVCIINIESKDVMLLVLGIAWMVEGITGIISAFNKSAVVYIPQ